jgi:maltooligosyltrehalose trehalohydrolase
VDVTFPYHTVYADAGLPSPMIGAVGPFGPEIDYRQPFARAYVQAANAYWLREYHVDGFRFDEVTDMYDGPTGVAYAKMAYDAYQASLALPRFTPSGAAKAGEYSRIILVPEALNRPQEILQTTYSNGTWQDNLLAKARDMAARGYVDDAFARLLDATASGYPLTKTVTDGAGGAVAMPVAPFQYLDSHDHSPLLASFSTPPDGAVFADRGRWYKLQPFAIALYTCEGTPMLWQGQEFADNSLLPPSGDARIHYRRNVHWEYFYDTIGAPLIRLYRILGGLRQSCPALRSHESAYDSASSQPGNGVVVYRRLSTPTGQRAVVVLNFADQAQTLPVAFPAPGVYRERIDSQASVCVDQAEQAVSITVPSNYGAVYVA